MKRLIALVLVLMLCALPALAELWYTDDILEDGSPIYYFEELSLTLPASWAGKVMAMEEEGGTSFYQKASYEKYLEEGLEGGGFLFMLGASVNGSFSQLPAFEYLGYSEASAMNYYFQLPTDYPAYNDDDIRAEYDAMYAQIGEVVAGVSFYGQDSAPDAPAIEAGGDDGSPAAVDTADQGGAQDSGITLEQARYHFEHSALPRYFYEAPDNMLSVLSENGTYRLWQALVDENGVEYPYQPGDYVEHWYTTDDGSTLLQIEMPAPTATPQCYRAYMFYDPGTGKAGYYTVEYEDLLGVTAFLCGWTETLEHVNYGGAAILDADSPAYEAALLAEAREVASLAGTELSIHPTDRTRPGGADDSSGLVEIPCPELGFSIMADPAYSWDYKEGTGVTVYTEEQGRIPYVIVWRSEDLIVEAYEYIREQYTPHIQEKYGDDLVSFEEFEAFDFGSKQLPAGFYTYRVQDRLVDMIRVYDSTGNRTVAYTMKAIHDQTGPTMTALENAIRYFNAE